MLKKNWSYGFGYGLWPKAEVCQGRTFVYGRRWKMWLRSNTDWRTRKPWLMSSTRFQPAVSVDLFVKWFRTGLLLRCLPRDWMSFDFFLGPQLEKKQVFGQVFQLGYDQNQVFLCAGTKTKVQFRYRTRAIISRSWLEAALEYKPYIRTEFSEKTSLKTKKWSLEMG